MQTKVFFNRYVDAFLDLLFPPICEVCRQPSKAPLCLTCFSQIKFMKPQMGIYSVGIYETVLKEALHRFKFKKRKRLIDPFGILLVNYLSQIQGLDLEKIKAIVPVPLHRNRLKERGFNQSELLASVVGHYFGRPVIHALERHKATKSQFDLEREKRFHNVAGAFRVPIPGTIYQKEVVLIDDIYTTGATMHECARELKLAGAAKVHFLTLARAVDRG